MKLFLLLFIAGAATLFSAYIDDSLMYSLLKKDRNYMSLVAEAYKSKVYTSEELQSALANESHHPLSDILRIAAYDEVSDPQRIQNYLNNIEYNSQILQKFPPFALLLSDILLRLGENDRVLKLLPRRDIVMLPLKEKRRAYYYRAMAKYLTDGDISPEFEMIKNHFDITKGIYYEDTRKQK